MNYAESRATKQTRVDAGASIGHTKELIEEIAKEQRKLSCQAIQDFVDDVKNLVSPQVIKAFQRAISIANSTKLETTDTEE